MFSSFHEMRCPGSNHSIYPDQFSGIPSTNCPAISHLGEPIRENQTDFDFFAGSAMFQG
jgi:hypothetical protein